MDTKKRRRVIDLLSFFILIAILVSVTLVFGDALIEMVRDPSAFQQRTDAIGIVGRLLYVSLIALQIILAVLPGQIFALAGGYCFGIFWGTVLTLIGTLIGSTVAFLLARFFGVRAVTAFYSKEKLKNLSFLRESKQQDFFTLIVFLIPGIPKDMVTYFMGLTQMKLPKFLLLSICGRFPGILLSVLSAAAIQTKNLTLLIVCVCVVTVLIVAGALFYKRHRSSKMSSDEKSAN